jgi:hypothetical protein
VLCLACDPTKAIAALLPVTDSLAVCWLNAPALNSSKSRVETAREMFGTGLHPLALWVAVRWDGQAGALHTQGMARFGASGICLPKQAMPTRGWSIPSSMWRSPFSRCLTRFPPAKPWTAPKAG